MTKNINDLHDERLATTDENGKRIYLYPEDVHGKWKNARLTVYWFLIVIYLVIPWVNFNGKQVLLFNIIEREFVFFGTSFWGHDVPLLAFVLLSFIFFIGLVTSILGRVWCGWACPQTVFIHTIFFQIERLVEGHARHRRSLDKEKMGGRKFFIKALKWLLFLLVSLIISHSFLGYFVGARNLLHMVTADPLEHWTSFLTMLGVTGIILFDFGWFREQFCLIACPYGRFQSVMMDENSLVVAYDAKRGEPRRNTDVKKEDEGDCINCHWCVKVCPTGVDIRRGTQMECIACTACIDACDTIMEKVKKPKGLIRYSSEKELAGGTTTLFSPRVLIYGSALLFFVGIFLFTLNSTNKLSVILLRGSNTPFSVVEATKDVLNHYKVEFHYNGKEHYDLYFTVPDKFQKEGLRLVTPRIPFSMDAGRKKIAHLFFKFPSSFLKNGKRILSLEIYNGKPHEKGVLILTKEVTLIGPYE